MQRKTILISGSTDGIGRQIALELAAKGARVVIHGRFRIRCEQTVSFIKDQISNADVEFICADFSKLVEVRKAAAEIIRRFNKLEVLINNAGVFEAQRHLTVDGLERTFAVNHLAPFLLSGLLLNMLKAAAPSRIVTVSSMAHAATIDFDNLQGQKQYSGYEAYGLSKLANILFTFALAKRLKNSGITVNCLHPGVIDTKLLHAGWGMGGAPVREGAKTALYLALSEELDRISGKYFSQMRQTEPAALAKDPVVQERLWEESERLCAFRYPKL